MGRGADRWSGRWGRVKWLMRTKYGEAASWFQLEDWKAFWMIIKEFFEVEDYRADWLAPILRPAAAKPYSLTKQGSELHIIHN